MQPRSLDIFIKRKGLYVSPENLVFIFLAASVFLIWYLKESQDVDFSGWESNLSIIWVVYTFALLGSNFFRYEREIGEYQGKLTFFEDRIQINDKSYGILEIKRLDFNQAYDVRGMFKNSTVEFAPHLSNGLDNEMVLELKNGIKVKCNFLQTESERLRYFKEVLVHYYNMGIVGWLELLDILGIEDYKKIQEFKKEINVLGTRDHISSPK